MDIVVNDR